MPYSLRRHADGAGDSGPLSLCLWIEDKALKSEKGRPRVGVVMQVGSFYARTYAAQDYWQTTPITEIISETEDEVVFKTQNSTYTWKHF